jgi:hypothetical protein
LVEHAVKQELFRPVAAKGDDRERMGHSTAVSTLQAARA